MKAALIVIVVVSALVLLAFAVHDLISFGMGISSSASDASKQFWDAVGDALSWGIEYKAGATAVFLICLAILYIGRNPTIKSR
jgi:ABC-type Fe3+ transport system permease subunit